MHLVRVGVLLVVLLVVLAEHAIPAAKLDLPAKDLDYVQHNGPFGILLGLPGQECRTMTVIAREGYVLAFMCPPTNRLQTNPEGPSLRASLYSYYWE
jgi:hypothetical protein